MSALQQFYKQLTGQAILTLDCLT